MKTGHGLRSIPLAFAQILLSLTSVAGTDLGTLSPESPLEDPSTRPGLRCRSSVGPRSLTPISPSPTGCSRFTCAIPGEGVTPVAPVAAPTLSVATTPKGGAVVTFSGKLPSATSVGDNFSDVPGNPSGIYAVPQEQLQEPQFFRALKNQPLPSFLRPLGDLFPRHRDDLSSPRFPKDHHIVPARLPS